MLTRFCMQILKVLGFMPQGDMCIWQSREERKNCFSVRKRKKNMRWCQFPQHIWCYNKWLLVLKFWIYHVWLRGEIRTSLPMTCLVSGAKALLLMKTTALPSRTFQMRCHNLNMVTVGYQNKSFARGDQKHSTTLIRISKNIIVRS